VAWFKWVYGSSDRREGVAPSWRLGAPFQEIYDSDLMKVAAFLGSLEAIEWMTSQGTALEDTLMKHCGNGAACGGHREILEWLRTEGGYEYDAGTMHGAVFGVRPLQTVKWLRSQDPPCDWDSMSIRGAMERGHLEVAKYLNREGCACP